MAADPVHGAAAHWYRRLRVRLLTMKPREASRTVALRNAIGVTLPLVIGYLADNLPAGLAVATGALLVMFSDQPGPYRVRFQRLLLASLGGALAALAGFSLGAQPLLLVPLVLAWVFAASLLVALGDAATRVGLTSIIILLITSARTDLGAPLPASMLIFAGGMLQTLLAVLLWPLDPHRPQRLQLADALRALAGVARKLPGRSAPPPASATMNALQGALLKRSSQRSLIDERFCILVGEYEQLRLALVALADICPASRGRDRSLLLNWLGRVAITLEAAADRIGRDGPANAVDLAANAMSDGLRGLQRHRPDALSGPRWSSLLDAAEKLARHALVVARNCSLDREHGEASPTEASRSVPLVLRPGRPLNILHANLRWHSVAFRHALRSAVVVTACLAAARWADLAYGYWVPMTAAIILKPDFAATFIAGVLRTFGTLAGLLLMSALLHLVLTDTPGRIVAVAVLCFAFRDLAPRHYGLGVAALSGMLVLLLALAGAAPLPLVEARAVSTVLGSAVALAAFMIWPSWERGRVRLALAAMLDAWADYLGSLRDEDLARHAEVRRSARSTRSNAEASLERLRHEPRTGEGLLAGREAFLIAGNRLARVAMRLDALLLATPALRQLPELRALLDALVAHTTRLGRCMRSGAVPDAGAREAVLASARSLRALPAARHDDLLLRELGERLDAITAELDQVVSQLNGSP